MKKIFLPVLAIALAAACVPDERNQFIPADSFGVTAKSLVAEASVHTGTYTVGIAKNGKGQQPGTVFINQDQDAYLPLLEAYNKENGTHYEAVLGSLIDVEKPELSFGKEDVVKNLSLTWDPELMAAFMGNKENYVIPILIDSKDLGTSNGRQFMLIHLTRSSVSLVQKTIARTVDKKTVEPDKNGNQPPLQETILLDVVLDHAIKGVSIDYPVEVDNSLIEEFSLQKGVPYEAVPEGLIVLDTPTMHIPEGGLSGNIRLNVDYSTLLKDGKLQEFPSYVLPVRLNTQQAKASQNGRDFELKGVSYGNSIAYITVDWKKILQGINIRRQWGKYSSASNSWNAYFGGTADADRNFTMDDEYIYVPEASTEEAVIWKISIDNPDNCAKVASPTTPSGYFKMSAARVMDPGTDKMNGGKPMLIASNMVMEEGGPLLKLYIYDKGTDTAPTEWSMNETGLGRRLGDIFTVHGTFNDGGFLFKDWDKVYGNGTILVWRTAFESVPNYAQTPRNPVWNTIKEEGGRAAFYPYPDQKTPQYGIYAGPESAYFVSENGSNVYTWNPSSFDATAASEAYHGAYDFNFFAFHGKRYIAYVQNISSVDGRLWVLEGEAADSWEDILGAKRNVIFQASLQQDLQFSDDEEHEELAEPSPKSSGASGIGCAARLIGDDVIIMAGKQNVGLSVFKMEFIEE